MKRNITILAIVLFVIAGCIGCRQSGSQNNGFITVDVTKENYPKKELILQDFMDVEYIPLETNDEFVCQGFVRDIGKEMIVVKNRNDDGNVFIFDRKTGKALKKINRKGQGSEEYIRITDIILDEDNGEIFINSSYQKKIFVYDFDGNFKRTFLHKDGARYVSVYHYDRENLICYDGSYVKEANEPLFSVISKQDGSITKDILVPFENKALTWVSRLDEASGLTYSFHMSGDSPLIPYKDGWIIAESSSDTIYSFFSDCRITPFIVRTPPVRSMNPEVFLFPQTLTDRYYFMVLEKKVWDWDSNDGFPMTFLVYDKLEKAIFKYIVYNGDYSNKEEVFMMSHPLDDEIRNCQSLEASDLVEAYGKGRLKGRLKEIAATLDEESNPVIMLIKHKSLK